MLQNASLGRVQALRQWTLGTFLVYVVALAMIGEAGLKSEALFFKAAALAANLLAATWAIGAAGILWRGAQAQIIPALLPAMECVLVITVGQVFGLHRLPVLAAGLGGAVFVTLVWELLPRMVTDDGEGAAPNPPIAHAAAFALFLVFGACIAWRRRLAEMDDAMITLRYVRNILNGHGWVYNLGEHVDGSTSTLHTILLCLAGSAMRARLTWAPVVTFALGSAALSFCSYLLFSRGGWMAAVLGGLFCGNFHLLSLTIGLETAVYLALSLGAICLYSRQRFRAAALILGLQNLARPDGVVLTAILAFHFIFSLSPRSGQRRVTRMQCLLLYLAIVTPWLVYSRIRFGQFLPNTVAAKMAQAHSGQWKTFGPGVYGALAHAEARKPWGPGWPSLFGLGIIGAATALRSGVGLRLLLAWGLAISWAYSRLGAPNYHWYYAPLHFIGFFFAACLVARLWSATQGLLGASRHLSRAVLACLGLLFFHATFPQIGGTTGAYYPHYQQAADWLRANSREDDVIAAVEIGNLGYHVGDRNIIDICGLIHPASLESVSRGDFLWWHKNPLPDFLVFHYPPWFMEKSAEEIPSFSRTYHEAKRIAQTGETSIVIYKKIADLETEPGG